jgi:hypothetical protein
MDVKTQRILLESAARTATTACAQQTDKTHRSVRVYLNVTAASGAGGLKVIIRGYDKVSGNPAAITGGGLTAITAAGIYVYELMPYAGESVGAVQETQGRLLPVGWDAEVTHADASSYTYSLSADVG